MSGRFASAKVVIALPMLVSTILALIAGGLQTVSAVLLAPYPEIRGIVSVVIVFLVAEGITPLTGSPFARALPPWATHLGSAVVALLAGAVATVPMSHGVQVGLVDVLTILGALGFGTAAVPMMITASAAIASGGIAGSPVGRAVQ